MDSLLQLNESEQRQYLEETANRLGLPRTSIEKDFWVCWTLRELFRLPEWGGHLTFKGGTSLSKGWKLIQRFSEDIDIVIDRERLGFGGEASPEFAKSPSATKRQIKKLKGACQTLVHEVLKPGLQEAARRELPEGARWEFLADNEDPDEQTLLFLYPQLFAPGGGYSKPQVKIELGARSDTEPSLNIAIVPYVAEGFPEFRSESEFRVQAVRPVRTFWEKAMLLHEEAYRPPDKPRKGGLGRHYYDLTCLVEKGVADQAVRTAGLFERAAQHRRIYFKQSWMDYGTIKRGGLRLRPRTGDMDYWKRDYSAMRAEMFFGEVPTFEHVLAVVGRFEDEFNGVAG